MRLFRIYVDGALFYHPQLSKLAVTEAKVEEDAENIDSLTLSAPYNHPYLHSIKPMASVIVCKKGNETVFEGRALDDGSDFYNTHTWTCESALSYLNDSQQPPYNYKGNLRGLFEYFIAEHNKSVEEQKRFLVGEVTVVDNNDYVAYSCSDYSMTLDAIKDKLIKTHGGYLRLRYTSVGKMLDYLADFAPYDTVHVGDTDYLLVHSGIAGYREGRDLDDYPEEAFRTDGEKTALSFPGMTVVCGGRPIGESFTPESKIRRSEGLIELDCGAGHGGRLGCLRLDDGAEFYV